MDAVERLSPAQAREPSLLGLMHVHRYKLAAELCAGRRVLDLCCGTGYGMRILARTAASVHGVDSDEGSLGLARGETEGLANVSLELADPLGVLERPLERDFDAIVLFEGLEHLADTERALAALRARIEAGIGLVISVANGRGFDYERATGALESLGMDEILLQFQAEGSVIGSPEAEGVEAELRSRERAAPEHCNYLIGIANLAEAAHSRPASTQMQISAAPAPNTHVLQLEEENRQLARANLRLARERVGIADSAAAAALERLRRAEEQAAIQVGARGALQRSLRTLKRALAFIVPHGLMVLQQRVKEALSNDDGSPPGASRRPH